MFSFSKLKDVILSGDDFVLICHEKPDGDAIGSLLALGRLLEGLGKRVRMVCADPVPKIYFFLKDCSSIEHDFDFADADAIILLDNGDFKRTGFVEKLKKAKKVGKTIVNIDHHIRNDIWKFASLNCADETACATAEILWQMSKEMGWNIDSQTATFLLAGVYNDTGGLQHANTKNETFLIVSEMLSHGAKLKEISENIFYQKGIASLKLWGLAINKAKIIKKYGIIVTAITKKEMDGIGANDEDMAGLVGLLNTTATARASLLLYEAEDGKIRGSLRTEDGSLDLSELAKLLGGGGHKKAAGFLLDGKIEPSENGWTIK